MTTYTEENKHLIKVFVDEVINKKNLLALRDFLDPSFEGNFENIVTFSGINQTYMLLQMLFDKVPDFKIRIENCTAENDKVTAQIDICQGFLFDKNGSENTSLHTFRIEWGKLVQYCGNQSLLIPNEILRILKDKKNLKNLIQPYGYPTIPLE